MAPLSVTVTAPQAFANRRASLNSFSSCMKGGKGTVKVKFGVLTMTGYFLGDINAAEVQAYLHSCITDDGV